MTTTSGLPNDGHDAGRRRPGGRRIGLLVGVIVAIVAVAAVAWLFVAGPMSSSARTEREVEQVVGDLGASGSLAEFNAHLCAEQRMPQEMLDGIAGSGAQTGVDLDAMFREQVMGNFPEEFRVTGVDVDGDSATATIESSGENAASEPETLHLRREDGAWKVCEPAVGMGAVPDQQSGN